MALLLTASLLEGVRNHGAEGAVVLNIVGRRLSDRRCQDGAVSLTLTPWD